MRVVARIYKLMGGRGAYVRTHHDKHFRINVNEHPNTIVCIETGDVLNYEWAKTNLYLESFIVADEFNREFNWTTEQIKSCINDFTNASLDRRGGLRIK